MSDTLTAPPRASTFKFQQQAKPRFDNIVSTAGGSRGKPPFGHDGRNNMPADDGEPEKRTGTKG